MQVINTASWAGADFSYAPGEVVTLPDDVALARIAAGLADPIVDAVPADAAAPVAAPRKRKG